MKCPNCEKEFNIKLGSKILCNGCRVLTNITSVITVQCENCGKVFQVPIFSKSFLSVKKDEGEE